MTEELQNNLPASEDEQMQTKTPATEEVVEVAHDDFDWNIGRREEQTYSAEENDELSKMYSDTFKTIQEHEIITGRVEAITNSDVVMDIGFKSDGLVPRSEFRDTPDLKAGDTVEVYVLSLIHI